MEFPRLSIHQTFALIGIKTTPGKLQIESPPGDLSIEQPKADVSIDSPRGQLTINSDAAWSALGVGPNLQWCNNIYSQMPSIALQAIAKIAEQGDQMANISSHQDAIADLAAQSFPPSDPVEYTTEPAIDNVKIDYEAQAPKIQVTPHSPMIHYQPHRPTIQYQRGAVETYMRQKQSIEIQVASNNQYA